MLDSPDEQPKRGLLVHGVEGFLRWSMEGVFPAKIENFHLNCVCICIHRFTCIRGILGR